jgi:hypothetical protein
MGWATEKTVLTDDLEVSSRNEENNPVVDSLPPVLGLLVDNGEGVAFGEGELLGGRSFVRVEGLRLDDYENIGVQRGSATEWREGRDERLTNWWRSRRRKTRGTIRTVDL